MHRPVLVINFVLRRWFKVVDFPLPVGPVTSTKPCFLLARSSTVFVSPNSLNESILNGIALNEPAIAPLC